MKPTVRPLAEHDETIRLHLAAETCELNGGSFTPHFAKIILPQFSYEPPNPVRLDAWVGTAAIKN